MSSVVGCTRRCTIGCAATTSVFVWFASQVLLWSSARGLVAEVVIGPVVTQIALATQLNMSSVGVFGAVNVSAPLK